MPKKYIVFNVPNPDDADELAFPSAKVFKQLAEENITLTCSDGTTITFVANDTSIKDEDYDIAFRHGKKNADLIPDKTKYVRYSSGAKNANYKRMMDDMTATAKQAVKEPTNNQYADAIKGLIDAWGDKDLPVKEAGEDYVGAAVRAQIAKTGFSEPENFAAIIKEAKEKMAFIFEDFKGKRVAIADNDYHRAAQAILEDLLLFHHEPNDWVQEHIIGSSNAIKEVRYWIRKYAKLNEPVLILGKSGDGKELVAKGLAKLRQGSSQDETNATRTRDTRPQKKVMPRQGSCQDEPNDTFTTYNCAARSGGGGDDNILLCEIFGCTDAYAKSVRLRSENSTGEGNIPSLFDKAASTKSRILYFQEVYKMNSNIQGLLLDMLERTDRMYSPMPMGSPLENVDKEVRFVWAMNETSKKELIDGSYRKNYKELYDKDFNLSGEFLSRISILVIEMPTLQDRCEDIEPLIEHFLKGKEKSLTQSATEKLVERFKSNGSVRDLRNAITRGAAIAGESPIITTEDIKIIAPSYTADSAPLPLTAGNKVDEHLPNETGLEALLRAKTKDLVFLPQDEQKWLLEMERCNRANLAEVDRPTANIRLREQGRVLGADPSTVSTLKRDLKEPTNWPEWIKPEDIQIYFPQTQAWFNR